MNLVKSIQELLYKHDCVIVPGFGGFITQQISADFNPMNYEFTPPRKTLSFNVDLTQNDGLLVHYVSKKYQIQSEEANNWLNDTVTQWKNNLYQSNRISLEGLGDFFIENQILQFNPNQTQNYLLSSFGLDAVKGNYILREKSEIPVNTTINNWKSYAAAVGFAILIGAGSFFANNQIVQHQLSSVVPFFNVNSEKTTVVEKNPVVEESKVQPKVLAVELDEKNSTVAVVLPEEILSKEDKIEIESIKIHKYQVIGGSFKKYYQAMEKEAELRRKGFENAIIIGNVGNYTMVAYETFENYEDALALKRELEQKGKDVFIRP